MMNYKIGSAKKRVNIARLNFETIVNPLFQEEIEYHNYLVDSDIQPYQSHISHKTDHIPHPFCEFMSQHIFESAALRNRLFSVSRESSDQRHVRNCDANHTVN
jgi:hypothetical protein